MHLTPVDFNNRRDMRSFLNLPFEIYRGIPQWVPPFQSGERARFNRDKYPFYKHSEAAFFLVKDEAGRALGRIAVLEHRPHNAYRQKRDALLYLYEAVDDDTVARLLFEAAAGWAASRGLDRLVGPKGFRTGDGLGLLIEGFERRPALGVPYNPAYYVRQWEEIGGFEKVVDYLSAYISRATYQFPERLARIVERVKERSGFSVARFGSKRALRAMAEQVKQAYNSAFVDVWAYTPIPDEELDALVSDLLLIADPKLMKLIIKDGELAGFLFCYPDVSAAIQRIKGRLWPLGWIDLLIERGRTEWVNINGAAILPAYQGRGANAMLYDEIRASTLSEPRYRHADIVQIQETNAKMLADMEALGVRVYKRHRVYHKTLGG